MMSENMIPVKLKETREHFMEVKASCLLLLEIVKLSIKSLSPSLSSLQNVFVSSNSRA